MNPIGILGNYLLGVVSRYMWPYFSKAYTIFV